MSRFTIPDCEGNMVEISAKQIGQLLFTVYFDEYKGEDNIETVIGWFMNGCPDEEEDDEE